MTRRPPPPDIIRFSCLQESDTFLSAPPQGFRWSDGKTALLPQCFRFPSHQKNRYSAPSPKFQILHFLDEQPDSGTRFCEEAFPLTFSSLSSPKMNYLLFRTCTRLLLLESTEPRPPRKILLFTVIENQIISILRLRKDPVGRNHKAPFPKKMLSIWS